MTSMPSARFARVLGCLGAAVLLWSVPADVQAQRKAGAFAGLAGSWSGVGSLTLASGANERVRCRSTYNVDGSGDQVQLTLRCASDSYRFDLAGNVVSQGGAISGTWSEATRNVSGSLSGSASAGKIQARVDAQGFAANLYITVNGNQQGVSISSAGTELSRVTLTMTRSGA